MIYSMSDELLTVAELAKRWKLSELTIRRRIKLGLVPSIRLDKSIRIRLSDVERIEGKSKDGDNQ